MKKTIVLILTLVLCVSMCACGGNKGLTSPGSADGETSQSGANTGTDAVTSDGAGSDDGSDTVNNDGTPVTDGANGAATDGPTADGADNTDSTNNTGNTGGNNATGGNEVQPNTLRPSIDTTDKAPENTGTYNYSVGGKTITISYGNGMAASEEGGMTLITYGTDRLYVEDVTDSYDPNGDASNYLYQYAYRTALPLVNATYGDVSDFDGEVVMSGTGNEIMGYAGTMTCSGNSTVYAFVKWVKLDNNAGYAVETGICDGANATVFNNVEVH